METLFVWLVDTFYEWGKYAYDLFLGEEGFVWYVFDFGIDMGEWFLSLLPDLSALLVQFDGGTAPVPLQSEEGMIVSTSGQSPVSTFGFVMALIGRMNAFFPVVESGTLFVIYLIFMLIVLKVRLIFKLTPTLGG